MMYFAVLHPKFKRFWRDVVKNIEETLFHFTLITQPSPMTLSVTSASSILDGGR